MVQHNKKLDVEVLQNYTSFPGAPFFFVRAHMLIVFDPIFNVVEHRHEYGSSFEITRFRRSQECVTHDLDCWVA